MCARTKHVYPTLRNPILNFPLEQCYLWLTYSHTIHGITPLATQKAPVDFARGAFCFVRACVVCRRQLQHRASSCIFWISDSKSAARHWYSHYVLRSTNYVLVLSTLLFRPNCR